MTLKRYLCLVQAQLLQGMIGPLDHIMGLKDAKSTATKLLHFVRSVPGLTTVLVGQKVSMKIQPRLCICGTADCQAICLGAVMQPLLLWL